MDLCTLEGGELVDGENPLVHHHDHEGGHAIEHGRHHSATRVRKVE